MFKVAFLINVFSISLIICSTCLGLIDPINHVVLRLKIGSSTVRLKCPQSERSFFQGLLILKRDSCYLLQIILQIRTLNADNPIISYFVCLIVLCIVSIVCFDNLRSKKKVAL